MGGQVFPAGLGSSLGNPFRIEGEEHGPTLVQPGQGGIRVVPILFDALLEFAVGAVRFLEEEARKGRHWTGPANKAELRAL